MRGQRPAANRQGHFPNVDQGFTQKDVQERLPEVRKEILSRMLKLRKERPLGYLVREVPAEDVRTLRQLVGHLQAGLFVTKFRKIFRLDEMNDDLLLVAARVGQHDDISEYEEILPASPP
ncbi:MAG: hypothetical protein L0Z62_25105 [Gemmataceae bacterium]|nr:hypothetical protein [Gemmataceae bacterium]